MIRLPSSVYPLPESPQSLGASAISAVTKEGLQTTAEAPTKDPTNERLANPAWFVWRLEENLASNAIVNEIIEVGFIALAQLELHALIHSS